ncbi:putative lyase [Teratosphaeria destructans]|uniref:Lyase n=1 Tax=Teratosphaeria destructans TaxID=418781 RepID=A0A9W7VYZ3_9PEZI|nr:putative lyase [Teratosphaeria destructans]
MQAETTTTFKSIAFAGSCACKRITYESTTAPTHICICHCVSCRKISGGPYQIFAHVESSALTLYDNQLFFRYEGLPRADIGGIVFVELSSTGERAFCQTCRSSLAMRYKHEPNKNGLTMGTVDESSFRDEHVREAFRPGMHIFVSQKAWYDIIVDDLPQYERFSGSFEKDLHLAGGEEG